MEIDTHREPVAQSALFMEIRWSVEMNDDRMAVGVGLESAGEERPGRTGRREIVQEHADAHQEPPEDGLDVEPRT